MPPNYGKSDGSELNQEENCDRSLLNRLFFAVISVLKQELRAKATTMEISSEL